MKLRERIENFAYEWIGKGRSKAHIRSEFERHNEVALKACEYLGMLLLALVIYFYGEGKFYFFHFFAALLILYISAWAPDALYLLGNFVKREKKYIPTHRRKYSHGLPGLFLWTCAIGAAGFFLTEIFWAIIFAALAFTGYWLHLATDKVELFVDKIAEFVEKTFKEKTL